MKKLQRFFPLLLVAAFAAAILFGMGGMYLASRHLAVTFEALQGDASAWQGFALEGTTGALNGGVRFAFADGAVQQDFSLDGTEWNRPYGMLARYGLFTEAVIPPEERAQAQAQARLKSDVDDYGYERLATTTHSAAYMLEVTDYKTGGTVRIDTGERIRFSQPVDWATGPLSDRIDSFVEQDFGIDWSMQTESTDMTLRDVLLSAYFQSEPLVVGDALLFCFPGGHTMRSALYRVDEMLVGAKPGETEVDWGTQRVKLQPGSVEYGAATRLWQLSEPGALLWSGALGDCVGLIVRTQTEGASQTQLLLLDAQGKQLDSKPLPLADEVDATRGLSVRATWQADTGALGLCLQELNENGMAEQAVLFVSCYVKDNALQTLLTAVPDAQEIYLFQTNLPGTIRNDALILPNAEGTRLLCVRSLQLKQTAQRLRENGPGERMEVFVDTGVLLEVYESGNGVPVARGRLSSDESSDPLYYILGGGSTMPIPSMHNLSFTPILEPYRGYFYDVQIGGGSLTHINNSYLYFRY